MKAEQFKHHMRIIISDVRPPQHYLCSTQAICTVKIVHCPKKNAVCVNKVGNKLSFEFEDSSANILAWRYISTLMASVTDYGYQLRWDLTKCYFRLTRGK